MRPKALRRGGQRFQLVEGSDDMACAEVRVEASDAARKARGLQRIAVDSRHRAFLVQQPGTVQGKQHLTETGDGAKHAARQIGDVATVEALARIGQGERCLPSEALAGSCNARAWATSPT